MLKKHRLLKNINPPAFICIGVLFSYAILILLSIFGAFICNLTEDPVRILGTVSFIILLLTAALSGFTLSRIRKDGGVLLSMLSAAGFIVVRIVISLFLSGTDLADLLDCICYLSMGCVFALLGQRKLRRKHR